MIDNDVSFEKVVERLIIEALNVKDAVAFDSLLRLLPGVYPSQVLAALSRLYEKRNIPLDIYEAAVKYVRAPAAPISATGYLSKRYPLPLPHPLDFDWRFTTQSAEYIVEKCVNLSSAHDAIAFLGAPTAFLTAVESNIDRELHLLDRNPIMIAFINELLPNARLYQCNLFCDVIPDIQTAVTVIDPPWYAEHFECFMWVASQLSELGSSALVSLPAVGTREGIHEERNQFIHWCESVGFSLLKYEENVLRYVSPLFEVNALRAENLHNIPLDWRAADLAIFQKKNSCNVPRPVAHTDINVWKLASIAGFDWRIKEKDVVGFKSPLLENILRGDVLPSVSRKESLRKYADVWTPGNRIFSCTGTNVLHLVIDGLNSDESLHHAVSNGLGVRLSNEEKKSIDRTARQIEDLLKTESVEIARYLGKM